MKVLNVTPILNVADVPASIAWFEKLGWKRHFSWNSGGMIACAADANAAGPANFAGIGSGKCEMFLCRDGQGSRGGPLPRHAQDDDTGGVWMSWWVASPAEVDAVHALAIEHGMTVTRQPADEPWGVREFHLRHPDGHTFRVSAGTCDE
jgi:catechol 2,3-dioxygenase-like lactoylglutathione lyase family enzyme